MCFGSPHEHPEAVHSEDTLTQNGPIDVLMRLRNPEQYPVLTSTRGVAVTSRIRMDKRKFLFP